MARLLIVSRSMALAMRLADQHEVVEHPADQLDSLLPNLDADVLVLDLGDPVLAVNTVNSLREAEQAIPVLLVSGYQPEWEQVEAQQVEGVHVVPLPITRMALLTGVSALTGEDAAVTFVAAEDVEASSDTPPAEDSAPAAGGPGRGTPPAPVAPAPATQPSAARAPAAQVPAAQSAARAAADQDDETRETPIPPATVAPALPRSSPTKPPTPGTGTPATGPRTGEVPAVTRSEVEGLSYSTSLTRPFDQEPRTGQFPISRPGGRPAADPRGRSQGTTAYPNNPGFPGNSDPSVNPQTPGGIPAHDASWMDPQPGTTNGNAMARRMQRLGNRPRKLQRRPGPGDATYPQPPPGAGLVTDPLGPRTDPYGFPASDLDRRLDAEAAALVTRSGGEHGFALSTGELVRLLHERAGDLYSVSDTAQVLADDVIERADADAAAVLVPDGPVWRVSGGVGLRPLERRLEMHEAHWLITEIGSAGRAVLIEDTDIIRQQLSGAPLAAWRHLLAVPVPDIRGIVVLARGKEGGPFTDRDLSAVIAPVREAAALLAQAVETRRLARALDPLRES